MIYFIGSRITCLGRKFNYITPADLLVDYFGDGQVPRVHRRLHPFLLHSPDDGQRHWTPRCCSPRGTQGNIPYVGALLIMGVMVMIYVTSSGIRGVTWTTVAQAVWMFVAVWAGGHLVPEPDRRQPS